jgi:hypothetical protein
MANNPVILYNTGNKTTYDQTVIPNEKIYKHYTEEKTKKSFTSNAYINAFLRHLQAFCQIFFSVMPVVGILLAKLCLFGGRRVYIIPGVVLLACYPHGFFY